MSTNSRPVNYWSVIVAALAAFVMSSLYYSPPLLGGVWRAVDPVATAGMTFSPWKLLVEIPRTFGVTFVMAHLLTMLGGDDVRTAVKFALWIWFGFSALMWVGAVTWEQNPWQVAVIHSGDWLLKTVLIAVILGAWPKKTGQ
jgi:hypothetical protein